MTLRILRKLGVRPLGPLMHPFSEGWWCDHSEIDVPLTWTSTTGTVHFASVRFQNRFP